MAEYEYVTSREGVGYEIDWGVVKSIVHDYSWRKALLKCARVSRESHMLLPDVWELQVDRATALTVAGGETSVLFSDLLNYRNEPEHVINRLQHCMDSARTFDDQLRQMTVGVHQRTVASLNRHLAIAGGTQIGLEWIRNGCADFLILGGVVLTGGAVAAAYSACGGSAVIGADVAAKFVNGVLIGAAGSGIKAFVTLTGTHSVGKAMITFNLEMSQFFLACVFPPILRAAQGAGGPVLRLILIKSSAEGLSEGVKTYVSGGSVQQAIDAGLIKATLTGPLGMLLGQYINNQNWLLPIQVAVRLGVRGALQAIPQPKSAPRSVSSSVPVAAPRIQKPKEQLMDMLPYDDFAFIRSYAVRKMSCVANPGYGSPVSAACQN